MEKGRMVENDENGGNWNKGGTGGECWKREEWWRMMGMVEMGTKVALVENDGKGKNGGE